jgi:hypothetical protein
MREFKNPTALTRLAVLALWVSMAVDLLFVALSFYVYQSVLDLDPQFVGLVDIVAIANLAMLILCIIVVGCWIYRASTNAHALSDEMTISPGWAVGWYFVPIANLFKPYQGMREIWMASHYRGNWQDQPTPQLLIAWWALWLITSILGNISFRIAMNDETGAQLGLTTALDVAGASLNVVLTIILTSLMRRIASAQLASPYQETFA